VVRKPQQQPGPRQNSDAGPSDSTDAAPAQGSFVVVRSKNGIRGSRRASAT
jgi:hypothetical protein